ncbi:MAG: autotransporter-associated beta strand repeat-containing protein, partial [Thermoguttaceae bacterium]
LAGVVSGTGGLVESGSGVLTLSAVNTYTGGTTITSGTLQAGSASALGSATGPLIVNGGTLDLHGNSLAVGDLSSISSSTGIITNTSATAATLSVGGTSTPTWDYFYGSLQGSSTDTLGLTVVPPSVSGDYGLVLYSTQNDYYGATQVQAYAGKGWATLIDGATNALSQNSSVTLGSGSYLDLYGSSSKISSLANSGGVDNDKAGTTSTLTIGGSSSTTFSGQIFDNGGKMALMQAGSGTMALTGSSNTYTGGTTITSGTLQASSAGNLGSGTLTIGAGTLDATSGFAWSPNIALTSSSATIEVDSGTFTASGVVSGSGGLTKTGSSGTLALSGANTYAGSTTVSAGSVKLTNSLALQDSTLTTAGVVFDFSVTSNAFTFGGLSGSGAIALQNNATSPAAIALTVGGNNSSTTFAGVLSGSGSLIKSGSGKLTLSGNNTYTGGTTLAGGELSLGSANAIGTTGTMGAISFTGGTLQATASNTTDYSSHFSTTTGQAYSIDTNGQTVTWASSLTSSGGSLTLNDTAATKGLLIVSNSSNSFGGGTTITAGTLRAGSAAALGSTGGSLIVSTAGVLDLNGWNLTVGGLSGSGSITDSSATACTVTDNTADSNDVFSGLIVNGGSSGYMWVKYLAGGGPVPGFTQDGSTGGTTTGNALPGDPSSGIAGDGAAMANVASGFLLNPAASGSGGGGPVGVIKSGTGKLTLSGANSYSNGTGITGGILQVANAANLGGGSGGSGFGLLTIGAGTLEAAGTFSLNEAAALSNAAATMQVDNDYALTMQGAITGSGTLNKSGGGTLALSPASGNTSTFSGGVAINGGVLQAASAGALGTGGSLTINGATFEATSGFTWSRGITLGNGAATVKVDSGTLAATGVISGSGVLNKSGTGTLTLSGANLTIAAGASYNVDLANSGADLLIVTGTLTINQNAVLNLSTTGLTNPPPVFLLINDLGTAAVNGTFSNMSEGSPVTIDGLHYFITYQYNYVPGGTSTLGNGKDVALVWYAAPTANISGPSSVALNGSATINLTNASDPSTAETNAGFHYSFATTEAALAGTYLTAGTNASELFTFPTAGVATVWGRVLDEDNRYSDYFLNINVGSITPDPALLAAVRQALAIPAGGSVLSTDWARLTSLTADSNQVQSLQGLQYAVNLQS